MTLSLIRLQSPLSGSCVARSLRMLAGSDASPAAEGVPLRLTADGLKAVVRSLNKKDLFEDACGAIVGQVRLGTSPQDDETDEDGLFNAVLRVGTVLKTRHAEGSSGWRFGLRVFRAATEDGRFEARGAADARKLRDLLRAAEAATEAADAAPEQAPRADGLDAAMDDAPRAFEGQLSGEVETEFDRRRRTGRSDGERALDAVHLELNGIRTRSGGDPGGVPEDVLEHLMREVTSAGDGEDGGRLSHTDVADLRRRLEQIAAGVPPESAEAIRAVSERVFAAAAASETERRSASSASVYALAERTTTLAAHDMAALPERECPICRDDFAVGERVIKMPCNHAHVFHKSCVAEWLERDDSCPMCRAALPVWLGRPQYA